MQMKVHCHKGTSTTTAPHKKDKVEPKGKELESALDSPKIAGHNISLEPMLILKVKINVGHISFQPTLNL